MGEPNDSLRARLTPPPIRSREGLPPNELELESKLDLNRGVRSSSLSSLISGVRDVNVLLLHLRILPPYAYAVGRITAQGSVGLNNQKYSTSQFYVQPRDKRLLKINNRNDTYFVCSSRNWRSARKRQVRSLGDVFDDKLIQTPSFIQFFDY